MTTSESKIEQKAVKLVWDNLGIKGLKLSVQGNTGFPDRTFFIPGGKPLMIEFKRPGEAPRPKQLKIHNELIELGYKVEVHDNAVNAFQAVIKAVDTKALHEEGRKILNRARRRCAVLRSRLGKNSDHARNDQGIKKTKADK